MSNPSSAGDDLEVDDILVRLSHHLVDLAEKINLAEVSISKSFIAAAYVDPDDVKNIQALDFIQQSIFDISAVLSALADKTGIESLDMSSLKMERTRELLINAKQNNDNRPGFVDLF